MIYMSTWDATQMATDNSSNNSSQHGDAAQIMTRPDLESHVNLVPMGVGTSVDGKSWSTQS